MGSIEAPNVVHCPALLLTAGWALIICLNQLSEGVLDTARSTGRACAVIFIGVNEALRA